MKKSFSSYLLIVLILFQIISAVPAGFLLATDPSGNSLGLSTEMLQGTPFSDFLIPGLILFFVLGAFPVIIFYGLLKKSKFPLAERINLYPDFHWAWTCSFYLGIILILWINMELLLIKSFDMLQFIFSMLGVAIIILTHHPATMRDFKLKD